MATELILQFEGETFHGDARRLIEVRGTDSGVIHLAVTTKGHAVQDRTMIALLPDELERVNREVNG